jgi:hypothetical protein
VYATFEVDVSIVDEKHREELGLSLYKQRKKAVKKGIAEEVTAEDEDDLLGFESVQSDWPPASSDRRKWWLDNGMSVPSNLLLAY